MASPTIDFSHYLHQRVRVTGDHLEIETARVPVSERLDCGAAIGAVPAQAIANASEHYTRLTNGKCQPQLAALIFEATRQPRALDFYFPLTKLLTKTEQPDFDQLVQSIVQQPNFDLRLIGEYGNNLAAQMPAGVAHLVAGHLAEIFFYRRDILERFLSAPRHIRLYATPWAFERDGGQAGGDYHADRETLQLVLSRLFEGFYEARPGVAPFLHEFGHMLDFFDAGKGRMGRSEGLLPGLSPQDGAVYTPHARKLFLKGKRLELERYLLRYRGQAKAADPLPIGHPYVFQNDTEFAAGYFEMFFRNPNYFAAQNADLYQAYVALFGYDPRPAWKEDFPFYVNENRNFYLTSGQKPWPPNLNAPES
jgi:hypothetical protein